MLKRLLSSALLFGFLAGTGIAVAEDTETGAKERITESLTRAIPGLQVLDVTESDVAGLYEVRTNGQETLYASEDGTHVLVGELFSVGAAGVVNVSEQKRAVERAERLESLAADDVISFKPENEIKAVVRVFTDIDCPYCRKLHDEVPALNAMGIQVDYLAFPRSGPNTPSFAKAVSTWCAEDPREAMNRAKSGKSVPPKTCDDPVAEQFQLGSEIGVTGTPAIILEDGSMIRGYVPKERLAQALGIK